MQIKRLNVEGCSCCQLPFLDNEENFPKDVYDRKHGVCKACMDQWGKDNPPNGEPESARCRKKRLYRLYMLSPEQTDYIYERANNTCELCQLDDQVPDPQTHWSLVVDHCHTSGRIRGILCYRCNYLLGICESARPVSPENDEKYQYSQWVSTYKEKILGYLPPRAEDAEPSEDSGLASVVATSDNDTSNNI